MAKKPVVTDNIINLDISAIKKKKFAINGDQSKILELNTSDMNIITRISEVYPKLQKLEDIASIVHTEHEGDEYTDAEIKEMGERLKDVDKQMRELIDYLFGAPVSEMCASDGSMYDPFNGTFRFEYIITVLLAQYEENLAAESSNVQADIKKHTEKYTK